MDHAKMIANRGEMLRCQKCFSPLHADQAILDDARRRGISLDFLPWRCRYGHTARQVLAPRPPMRFLATCGWCGTPVREFSRRGRPMLNHAACFRAGVGPPKRHSYVEVPA